MINSFHGQYRFLSNFWPSPVYLDSVLYPTVEHAYQAAKTLNMDWRARIARCNTPGIAKRMGREAPRRHWPPKLRISVMETLVEQKFELPRLKTALLKTGSHKLVEGNYWGDCFWGVCNSVGENHLGLILMGVRNRILKKEIDDA